jgi:hypothetical protein
MISHEVSLVRDIREREFKKDVWKPTVRST